MVVLGVERQVAYALLFFCILRCLPLNLARDVDVEPWEAWLLGWYREMALWKTGPATA